MKVSVKKKDFLPVLRLAANFAAGKNSSLPYLRSVTLQDNGSGELLVQTRNGESIFTFVHNIDSSGGETSVRVDIYELIDVIRNGGTESRLVVDQERDGELIVISGGGASVLDMVGSYQPGWEFEDKEFFGTIGAETLVESLDLIPFADVASSRYALNSVHFQQNLDDLDQGLHICASDGYRLAVLKAPMHVDFVGKGLEKREPFLIPCQVVAGLGKLAKHTGGVVDVSRGETRAVFSGNKWVVETQQVEGRFPHYEKCLETLGERIHFDAAEFVSAVGAVPKYTANEKKMKMAHYGLVMRLVDDRLSFASPWGRKGKIDAVGTSENAHIVELNIKFLLDALKPRRGEVALAYDEDSEQVQMTFQDNPRLLVCIQKMDSDRGMSAKEAEAGAEVAAD